MAGAFQATAFQGNAFQIGDVVIPPVVDDTPREIGGDRIVGGTFSRGKWRDLQSGREDRRARELRARKRKEREQQKAAQAALDAKRAEVAERRRLEGIAAQARIQELLTSNAIQARAGLQQIVAAGDQAAMMQQFAHLMRDDDDEEEDAIAILMGL